MSLSYEEFLALSSQINSRQNDPRSSDTVSRDLLQSLVDLGYLDEDNHVTSAGLEALAPYKVDNAVILAAGLSSRFAPISYEKPKGTLKVHGEVLIERQIKQLRDAGIDDITVVVGYKKEHFFYLEEMLGVRIVVNTEFVTRNNNSSLMAVRAQLGNTYVCSSDDYFTSNPFEPYVWHAYYAAQHIDGPTNEWCIETEGRHERITGVHIGGHDEPVMLGHVYFDRAFSTQFVRFLEADYDRPETAGKLWEEIYLDHIDKLDMCMRLYPSGTIFEFDSLDELRLFDPQFLDNVDIEAFDNIQSVLKCDKHDIRDIYPLKQGLTNLSCHFRVGDDEYVYRHPGVGTEQLVDRHAEVQALCVARDLGLDHTFLHADPDKGWKISRFIPNCTPFDPHNADHVRRAMTMAHRLHGADAHVDRSFNFYDESKRYEALLLQKGPIDIPGYRTMATDIDRLAEHVRHDNAPTCLCHNDFFGLNFLIDENDTFHLIDWEYAGMSDYANDFGTFAVCHELSEQEIDDALGYYFGRTPTVEERRHNLAHIALAGWCWYVWALLKEAEGDCVGEWLYIYYRYAKTYLPAALALYEEEA